MLFLAGIQKTAGVLPKLIQLPLSCIDWDYKLC